MGKGMTKFRKRQSRMDTDLVQKKIERFIYQINDSNKSFDMLVQGSLRQDVLTIKAREKQKVNTISHLINGEGFVCPKCLKADSTYSYSEHFAKCCRCNRKFMKPNRPRCIKHPTLTKPCYACRWEKTH